MTARKLKFSQDNNESNWDTLNNTAKEIIKEAIFKAADDRNGPEGWKTNEEALEEVEFKHRDGFIPFDHNRGGLMYRNFTDLMGYFGGGYTPAHAGADNEIQRQIDYGFKQTSEIMAERIGKEDMEYYFGGDVSKVTYQNLSELSENLLKQGQTESANKVGRWESEIQDIESENLSGDYASIMHEIRVMYHGLNDKGVHEASVSAAVNTEGPYHRTHISWAPKVFCEGSKEVTIKWRNNAELKRKLDKALKQVSKAIF